MARRKRSLINFNVPMAGKITGRRIASAAIIGGIVIGAWNWSERIPGVGQYAGLGKYYIMKGLGYKYVPRPGATI